MKKKLTHITFFSYSFSEMSFVNNTKYTNNNNHNIQMPKSVDVGGDMAFNGNALNFLYWNVSCFLNSYPVVKFLRFANLCSEEENKKKKHKTSSLHVLAMAMAMAKCTCAFCYFYRWKIHFHSQQLNGIAWCVRYVNNSTVYFKKTETTELDEMW